ncbi:unnamed protein product [Prunus armeniaca]
MSGPLTILSQKHTVNLVDPAFRTCASIATTKGLSISLYFPTSGLLVPSLDHNLLSVAQLTTILECIVTFWPNHYVFHDIFTRKTIGCGTRRGKLYYLDWAPDSETKIDQAFTTSGTLYEGERDKIWLLHKHLGHASFNYLKKFSFIIFQS